MAEAEGVSGRVQERRPEKQRRPGQGLQRHGMGIGVYSNMSSQMRLDKILYIKINQTAEIIKWQNLTLFEYYY